MHMTHNPNLVKTKRNFYGIIIGYIFGLISRLAHKKNVLLSKIISLQLAQSNGKVYFGSDCLLVGLQNIHCVGNFTALDRNRIEAINVHMGKNYKPCIILGDNVSMEYDCHIGAINRVEIHDHVLMASKIYISDHAHGKTTPDELQLPPNQRYIYSKGPVIIESHVWIGEGVAVMPGVRIGHHSVIGANAVVTHDIPPYSVAAGVPARVIKSYSTENYNSSAS